MMSSGTVAAGFAKGLVNYAGSLGVDPATLLTRAGVDLESLRDPEARLPLDGYVELIRAAIDLSGDPAFPLHFGADVDIREMSIVALLGQSRKTALEAFDVANHYATLDADVDTDGPNRLELVQKGRDLWVEDKRANPNATPELTESTFARATSAARRAGIDMLREVHFTHPEPPHRPDYERIFRVPVVFESHWNALKIDPDVLSRPIGLQPAYAGQILGERADTLLREMASRRSVRGEVEAMLRSSLPDRELDVISVARRLGMSRQTLYRRLKAENTTFKSVLDALRLTLANDYLAQGNLSIAEISFRLGFADGPSFSKAFKRWTGSSPAARLGGN